jgi:NSS family neurotransmitter:Na+ symporter
LPAEFHHEHWSSPRTFLLAAIGSAIGLGNIWRFPYITGVNGGGAFVLIYCLCILVIGLPLLMAELGIGRRGGQSPVRSMQILIEAEGRSPVWQILGWLAIITPTMGLMYYTVVAGWALDYAVGGVTGRFAGLDSGSSADSFADLTGNPPRMMLSHALLMLTTMTIVAFGIRKGLERAVKWLMPALGLILLMLVSYAAVTADFAGALKFLFQPDFFRVTPAVVLMAVGQAFFSVNVAVGAMITYGAYMPKHVSIPKVACVIAFADTGVALLMGLVIFPLVLTYGLAPGEGPGLVFVTLPIAFGQMPAGALFGGLFFILMGIAALTSTIGMLEPSVSWLEEHRGLKRAPMAFITGACIWLCGLAALLSFNVWAEFTPLDRFTMFAGKRIFDLLDFFVANVLMPGGGMLIALFAGWMMSRDSIREELGLDDRYLFAGWRFLVRFVAPVAIAAIFVMNLLGT